MDEINDKQIEPAEESLEAKLARLQAQVNKLQGERDEALAVAEAAAAQRSGPAPVVHIPDPRAGMCPRCKQAHQKGQCSLCDVCNRQYGAYYSSTNPDDPVCQRCGSRPWTGQTIRSASPEVGRPAAAFMRQHGLTFCDSCGRPPGVTFASTDPAATPPCGVCGSSPRPARIGR